MRIAHIGGLEVSVIGLGCNNFGRALDAEASAKVVAAALDAGIDFFDTASNYGEGQSESFLGAALGSRREDVVIATKFGVPVPGWDGSGGAASAYVRQSAERSLRELGTDYIDLLMIHFPDPNTPIEVTMAAMSELVEEGKVREIGCSNFGPTQLESATRAAESLGLALVCDQVHFSMVHRDPLHDGTVEVARRLGVSVLPYYPLASGLLTGKARRGQELEGRLKMDRYQHFLTEENFDLVEALDVFAIERGRSMVQIALGWLIAQEGVPAVTAGATRPQQVRANALAADWIPSADDLSELAGLLGG